jgi:hypothetical protein
MNPLRTAREHVGLSQADFAEALGYGGTRQSKWQMISDMERGAKPTAVFVTRLAEVYRRHGVPAECIVLSLRASAAARPPSRGCNSAGAGTSVGKRLVSPTR